MNRDRLDLLRLRMNPWPVVLALSVMPRRDRPKGGGLSFRVQPAVSGKRERPGCSGESLWSCPARLVPRRCMKCTSAARHAWVLGGVAGVSLEEAESVLASLQHHLVQTQAEEHCQIRRRCPRCGEQRPRKDQRRRQLRSLFGTTEVRAPEYERVLAEFGALLPYRRARALLGTIFPVGDLPTIGTIQRRTLQVGARPECEAIVTPRRCRRQQMRRRSRCPSTPVTCGRCAAISCGPSRCSLRKPAMIMESRSSSAVCQSRPIDRPGSCAACCIALAQHRAPS